MNAIRQRLVAAILLASICAPAMSADGVSDTTAPQGEIGYHDVFGADEVARSETSPEAAVERYLFIAGSAFNARLSTQTVTYPGAGCTYSDKAVTTDLQLPDGAQMLGVRTYYYNDGEPTRRVTTFLSTYDGLGGVTDLLSVGSTGTAGYHSEYFALASPVTVDNINKSYVLSAMMDTNLRFCGMRFFYQTP